MPEVFLSSDMYDEIYQLIVAALQEFRDEGIEKAARVAEEWDGLDCFDCGSGAQVGIAEEIRKLKSK